jgi:RNA polymerase sigma-70 factor (ECF subfamily)
MTAAERAGAGDAELIGAWRGGDEGAAAELVRRHTPALARFMAAWGARGDDLDDVVQEAFIRAFRGMDRFREEASFRTWLFTIGANVARDVGRQSRRRPILSLADHDVPAAGGNPEEHAEAEEALHRLEHAVEQLPPMQRKVFLLRAQQGLDYEEIAAGLKTSVGAARVHYHHAVKRLKKELG